MPVPRPSSGDLLDAAIAIAQHIHNEKAHDELGKCWGEARLRRVIDWLDAQAEQASEAEVDAVRRSGRGPDGERLTTPRDADDD